MAPLLIRRRKSSFNLYLRAVYAWQTSGYFSLAEFERLTQAGVFWITKFKAGCSLFDEQQEPFCLQKRLASETSDTVNLSCFIGASKRLPAHLVALRISEEEANKRRRYIRRDAKTQTDKILQNNA